MRGLNRRAFLKASGLTAAGISAAALAAGCGSHTFIQVPGSVPADAAGRTHVVLWHSFAAALGEALQKLIDEFNKSQKDIYVEAQFQGSYEQTMQKVAAAIVAKQVPDMTILSEITWRKMHLADALEPYNSYFGGDWQPSVYVDQFINEGTIKGQSWWIPFARSTPLFYFNKDMFAAAGLPETGPTTWEELKEYAPALMKQKGNPKVLALGGTYASWYFQSNIWTWGGHYSKQLDITIGQDPAIAAGNWMVDFVRKDKAAYLAAKPDIDFGNQVTATTMLSTGSLANTTELAKEKKFRLGTAFLLQHDGNFGAATGGSGFGIIRYAPKDRKQAAAEFIKWLAQPAKSAQWTMETGYMPAVKAAQQEPDLIALTKKDPNFGTALQQLPKTAPQDLVRPLVSNAGYMMDVGLQKLYSGTDSVESVFGRLQKQLQSRANLIDESYKKHYE